MPAAEELPTFDRLVRAYQGALVSERRYGDTHIGSVHMHWARVGAVLWQRQTARVAEEFTALYFNAAKEESFDAYLQGHFPGKARIVDAPGEGTARLARSSTAGGAGIVWARTRVAVGGAGTDPIRYYYVAQDKPCSATDTELVVRIVASAPGPDSKIRVSAGERSVLRVEDPLWDNSWTVQDLDVGEGTLLEKVDAARARIRTELFDERNGYEAAIVARMKAAGAETVVLFRSDFQGDALDCGLNRIFVGDANFETSPELLRDCRLAMPDVVMAGAGNQALPMTNATLDFSVAITFWDSPERFGLAAAKANAQAAVVEYFETREHQLLWDLAGIRGAIQRAVEDTQNITVTTTETPPAVSTLFDSYPLRRYRTTPSRVAVSLLNPVAL